MPMRAGAVPRRRPGHVTLERALSKLGLASRSEARALILEGAVSLDGRVAVDPSLPVVPERVRISIRGREARPWEALTIALNKPRGVVTTRSDPGGRRTVFDLLDGRSRRLVSVGRLDLATSGLLILTSDTRLADWLTDPANRVPRVYAVTVRGPVDDEALKTLEAGVRDRGDLLVASRIVLRKRSGRESHLTVTLQEGRNREIRRLFAAVGHEVTRLVRISFGGLELGDLRPGQWRPLGYDELAAAFPGAPIRRGRRTGTPRAT